MLKKRYLLGISIAAVSILLGSLLYGITTQAQIGKPRTYTDSVEITALEQSGVHFYTFNLTLPFAFTPKETFLNITDVWVTVIVGVFEGMDFKIDVAFNDGVAVTSPIHWCYTQSLNMFSIRIQDSSIYETIVGGINTLTIANPSRWQDGWVISWMRAFEATIFIEYEYEIR